MTEKDLKKLNRRELLEILLEQVKDNVRLTDDLAAARERLADREAKLSSAVNIAESALELNRIFEMAQTEIMLDITTENKALRSEIADLKARIARKK